MIHSAKFSICLLILWTIASICGLTQAFLVSPTSVLKNNQLSSASTIISSRSIVTESSSAHFAKKKRRRKQQQIDESAATTTPSSPTFTESSSSSGASDELPDFELPEELDEKPKKKKIPAGNLDEITPNMMGGPQSARPVNDLIRDRSLELKFEFDDEGEEDDGLPVPDFTEIAKNSPSNSDQPRGSLRKTKKYGVAETQEEEGSNPFKNIPFILDEKGNISIVKVSHG